LIPYKLELRPFIVNCNANSVTIYLFYSLNEPETNYREIIMEKKMVKVEGMSCEHCAKAVTAAVSALPGTSGVAVDLKGGTVTFNFDPAATALKTIEAAIVDAGYEVVG
jgi:copper chaperone